MLREYNAKLVDLSLRRKATTNYVIIRKNMGHIIKTINIIKYATIL